ncbi:MAG: hypothetical protein ABSF29_06925 [Tepidisphaeraceae bacterium]|jgi:hypothetical protein
MAWWTSRVYSQFFSDNWYYIFWSFWLAATGAVAGLLAYWIAIWQIAQSREAARQAMDAASAAAGAVERTLERLAWVNIVVDLNDLCAISGSVCAFLAARKFDLANARLCDLRRAIARARPHFENGQVDLESEIADVFNSCDAIQRVLIQRIGAPKSVTDTIVSEHVLKMNKIDFALNNAHSRATQKLGENHARAQ